MVRQVQQTQNMHHEKTPMQSKKFLAYMFASLCMKLYMFYATKVQEGDVVVMTAVICAVFLDVGYILGQASLDRFVRVAAITTGNEASEDKTSDAEKKVEP